MDPEIAFLIPTFVEEVRERLGRLAGCLAALDRDPEAAATVRRELHTVKGSARMMQIEPMAELSQGAEELLRSGRAGQGPLLRAVVARLESMVDELDRGGMPASDPVLVAELEAVAASPASGAGSTTR